MTGGPLPASERTRAESRGLDPVLDGSIGRGGEGWDGTGQRSRWAVLFIWGVSDGCWLLNTRHGLFSTVSS